MVVAKELLEDLEDFRGSQVEDAWWWRLDENGRFTAKSMYTKLEGLMLEDGSIAIEEGRVFSRIRKCVAPSKDAAFSWKLLHNRIPTKGNLSIRQVLSPETSLDCAMCEGELELANYLFLHCDFARKVWDSIMRWLGMHFLTPPNLFILWECWDGAATSNKIRNGFRMIWHAVAWSIWRARNDRIFNYNIGEVNELVEAIKVLS